jgi:hypothetical protein
MVGKALNPDSHSQPSLTTSSDDRFLAGGSIKKRALRSIRILTFGKVIRVNANEIKNMSVRGAQRQGNLLFDINRERSDYHG